MSVRVPVVVLGGRFLVLTMLILSLPPLAVPLGCGATWDVYATMFGMVGILVVYALVLLVLTRFLGRFAPPATMPPAAALRENMQRLLGVALLIVFLPSLISTPWTYILMADQYAPLAMQAQYFSPGIQRIWWMAYGQGWQGIFMALAGLALLVLPWRRTPPEMIDAPVAIQVAESAITTNEYECDACGATVAAEAIACQQCGADLTETTEAPAVTRMPRVIIIIAVAVPLLGAYWLMRQAPMSQSSGPRVEIPYHPQAIYLGRQVDSVVTIGTEMETIGTQDTDGKIIERQRLCTTMLVNDEVHIRVYDGINEDTVAMICGMLWRRQDIDHRILSLEREPAREAAHSVGHTRYFLPDDNEGIFTFSVVDNWLEYEQSFHVMTGEIRGPLNGNGDVIQVWYSNGTWHLEKSGIWLS